MYSCILFQRNLIVFVEEGTVKPEDLSPTVLRKIRHFVSEKDDLTDKIDFIVTLGGDGTLIHASTLFQVGEL